MKELGVRIIKALIIMGFAIVIVMTVGRFRGDPTVILAESKWQERSAELSELRLADRKAERTMHKRELDTRFARQRAEGIKISERLMTTALNTAYRRAAEGDYAAANRAYDRALDAMTTRLKSTGDAQGTMAAYNAASRAGINKYWNDPHTYDRVEQYDTAMRANIISEILRGGR